jgi:hypothetical protein
LTQKGLVPMMQGDDFATEPGRIMEVATWLCAPLVVGILSSLGLAPNYVVLVLNNEDRSLSHARSSNIHLKLFFFFFIPIFSAKVNMNVCFVYINHIAPCMCNSLKCWFKHPLPQVIVTKGCLVVYYLSN